VLRTSRFARSFGRLRARRGCGAGPATAGAKPPDAKCGPHPDAEINHAVAASQHIVLLRRSVSREPTRCPPFG